MRYGGVGFLGVGVEGGRFSGNPVSRAYAGTLQGVRRRKRQEVDTSRASRTTGEDSLSREIIRFRGESVRCRHLPLPSPLPPCYIPNPPRKQDCPKICVLQDGGVPRNSTREVECCSGRAPGGRLSCCLGYCVGIYFTGFWL